MSTTCKGCGAPIIWARTGKGYRIPMDPASKAWSLRESADGELWLGDQIDAHRSHFETCPQASRFRSRPRSATAPLFPLEPEE